MAVPKRKTSKAKKRKRRTHKGVAMPNVPSSQKTRAPGGRSKKYFCQVCDQPKSPHSICSNCGSYKGKQAVEVEAEE